MTLVALALGVGCAAPGPDAADLVDEPEELAGITALHNEARAALNVDPLVWDPDLAVIAERWAAACVDLSPPAGLIDHNPGRSDDYPGYVGENIYGAGGAATPEDAVASWLAEESDYDVVTNECDGPACGHYTQAVWAESTSVGCGHHSCEDFTFGHTIVCNYAPGGNVAGQRPYPYP